MWASWSSNCACGQIEPLKRQQPRARWRAAVGGGWLQAAGQPVHHLMVMIQAASFLASASLTWALAGMGTGPHTPEPPLMILAASLSTASFWPAYLAATSLYEGPTSFLSVAC